MDEKQKKVFMIAGIALGAIVLVLALLYLFLPSGEAPAPPPVVSAPAPVVEPAPAEKTIDYVHDTYLTQVNDTLWDISAKVYNDPKLWWYLVEPNEEIISYMYQRADGRWIAYVLPDKKLIIPREKFTSWEKIEQIKQSLVTYSVDFGSLPSRAQADPLVAKLRSDTYSAYLVPAGSAFLLRIGFFTNPDIAEVVGKEVVGKYPEISAYTIIQPGTQEIGKYRDELRKHFADIMNL